MNEASFLVACLPVDRANSATNWLTNDNDARYQALDALDLPDPILERIYGLYKRMYSALSPRPLISSPEQLLDYNRWILLVSRPVASGKLPDPEDIVGFTLFKVKTPGLKVGLMGTDGSADARRAVRSFAVRSFNTDGVFGEVSPPVEDKLEGDVPVVRFKDAKQVLKQLGVCGYSGRL